MLVRVLGVKEYARTWELQKRLVARRLRGEIPDTLLLVEHPSVYTRGVSSKAPVPLFLPHPLHSVERGGDITYHGPGQLVGYPIIHLGQRGLRARSYLRAVEAMSLIEAVRPLGVEAGAAARPPPESWSGGISSPFRSGSPSRTRSPITASP